MCLVNRKQAQHAALIQGIELCQKARRHDPLGRAVQERHVPAQQAFFNLRGLFARQGGVQKSGAHARFMQRPHLVVHQRNQRRDHHRQSLACALAGNGRHLVTQRLAAAGGHQHQRVAAGHHVFNDGLLRATEGTVAKNFLKNGVDRQNECY